MNLQQCIDLLGSNVEEVLLTLRGRGIKGEKGRSCQCPIAIYLHQCGFPKASVGMSTVAEEVQGASVYLPLYVRLFIDNFDRGSYPDLEKK